jgi:hypothetical protein
MSKKADILKKADTTQYYDLTSEEIVEIASLIALIEQAEAARNFIYSRITQNIADRHNIVDKEITLNFQEIMEKGATFAKLVVKD